jgi:DNA polymerase-3 subunit delta'
MGFDSFLGNTKAVSAVREMLASGRLPGALLFAGPDGVGKKTLALRLAKSLNCEKRPPGGDDCCGECPRCRKAEEFLTATRDDLRRRRESKDAQKRTDGLIYFDIQLIEPITRYILTDQIRQLRQVAYTHPFEFPRRVFIIDEAQTLHWQAVDLLLKVLEEPPDTTTLILICPNAYQLRPTIRSRCRLIPFSQVDPAVIAEVLAEGRKLTPAQRELGVRVAAGSVAKAKKFNYEDFVSRRQPWLDFLDGIASPAARSPGDIDWRLIFDATKALADNRDHFEETLDIGYSLLRDLLQIMEAGPEPQVIHVDLRPRLAKWAQKLGLGGLERLRSGLDQAYRLQTRNVNQQLGFEVLAIDLAAGAD